MSAETRLRIVLIETDVSIADLAEELREILNAAPENQDPFPRSQERESMNHNGDYWLFGLLEVEVVLMRSDDPGVLEIFLRTADDEFRSSLVQKLGKILSGRGYRVSLI